MARDVSLLSASRPELGELGPRFDRVRAVYQPIVDLATGEVVAYEALARGPLGSEVERPDLMFAAAARAGRLAELDWACRAAAASGALEAGLLPPLALFVNVEPETLGTAVPPHLARLLARARRLRIVVEVTERALTSDPRSLLAAVRFARESGWGIALDDVGANPDSLALMPFLRPDVIKLDLRLVQERPDADVASVANAVIAQAERTGARVLAEGIETQEHRRMAAALGATLGQGWFFGRPDRLLASPIAPSRPVRLLPPVPDADTTSAFAAVAGSRPTQVGPKRLLLPLSMHLERRAMREPEPPVVLGTFQEARHFTPHTSRRYARLARHAAFVAAMGVGMSPAPAEGVRGAALDGDDPIRGEWNIIVISPHFAAALVARDLGDTGPDPDRRFEFVVTYDRELVLQAASRLMARILPA